MLVEMGYLHRFRAKAFVNTTRHARWLRRAHNFMTPLMPLDNQTQQKETQQKETQQKAKQQTVRQVTSKVSQ
jgi:hypothetical protein